MFTLRFDIDVAATHDLCHKYVGRRITLNWLTTKPMGVLVASSILSDVL